MVRFILALFMCFLMTQGHAQKITQTEFFEAGARKFAGKVLSQRSHPPRFVGPNLDPDAVNFFLSILNPSNIKNVHDEVLNIGLNEKDEKSKIVFEKYSESLDHLKNIFNVYSLAFKNNPSIYGAEFLLCFDSQFDLMMFSTDLAPTLEGSENIDSESEKNAKKLLMTAKELSRKVAIISLLGLASVIKENKFALPQKSMALNALQRNMLKLKPAISQSEGTALMRAAGVME